MCFEDNYVGRQRLAPGRDVSRADPRFLIAMWFVYQRTLDGDGRTNNIAEAARLQGDSGVDCEEIGCPENFYTDSGELQFPINQGPTIVLALIKELKAKVSSWDEEIWDLIDEEDQQERELAEASQFDPDVSEFISEFGACLPQESEENEAETCYSTPCAKRRFLTLIQGHTAILSANGIPLANYALTLKSSMEAAMPPRMRQDLKDERRMEQRFSHEPQQEAHADSPENSVEQTVSGVEKMIGFLRRRVQDSEDNMFLDAAAAPAESKDVLDRRKKHQDRRYSSTVIAAAVKTQRGKFKPRPCLFCDTADHNSSRCSADLTLEKRKEILSNQKRCFRCFGPNHRSTSECSGPRFPCAICKSSRHYAPMHQNASAATSAIVDEVACGVDSTNALLWTSSAYVVIGGLWIPITVFIEGGRSITVMLPSLRKMLRDSPVGSRDLSVQTFASSHSIKNAPVFNVRLTGPFDKTTVELLALEHNFGVHPPVAAKTLQNPWSLESVGIADAPTSPQLSADEDSAVRQFISGLEYKDHQYVVEFPKRETIGLLSKNKNVALRRLQRKLSQLEREPLTYRRYHEELMKFVCEGHAVEVGTIAPDEPSEVEGSYFMPHHEVITGSGATEKWRIVFDCSSKDRGATSRNDHLLPGPNLNPELVSVLLNFRKHAVAVSADITKAYLQLAIRENDRSLFKFVWRAPGEREIKVFQMLKVIWGAASSGFLLAATIREHLKRGDPSCRELGEYLYADDFLQSSRSDQQAIEFIDRMRDTLRVAGMSLAKWKTNSNAITDHLVSTGADSSTFDRGGCGVLKVLGLSWEPKDDVFRFTTSSLSEQFESKSSLTKRAVLSIVPSYYDPLGWLMPFTIRGKIIVQKMWTANLEWTQTVSDEMREELAQWTTEARASAGFVSRRQYGDARRDPVGFQLHLFGDASQLAYACAAYIESRFSDGSSTFSLVMAKSRLAPRDRVSLPRLELLAALIAVRLNNFLVQRMRVEFEAFTYYIDTTVAFHWATSAKPGGWKTYVSNRVEEIQASSRREDWFHVRGTSNIADLATRGISAQTLTGSSEWWYGPEWLRLPASERPLSQPAATKPTFQDVRQEIRSVSAPIVSTAAGLNLDLFSSSSGAVRVLANVLRLTLHAGERVATASKLSSFDLFVDENGLLRARTRLTEGPFYTYEGKNPAVTPGQSRLASLLIVDAHRVNAHFGVSTVLSQLRRRFWITRGRQVIKSILRRCVICRERQAAPATQIEAPLPECRADFLAPFASTGLDFCGPFHVRHRLGSQKAYVAVFTCCPIRAVHLELLPSQNTPQTHLAVRRFLAAHPSCTRIISDNGASFVKAATELKRVFNSLKDPTVQEELNGRGVHWSFICPRAPWHRGFYQRVVGILKSTLVKTLGRSLIGYEEFRTILCELAGVINERPLTFVSTDPDAPAALTPAQFLRGGPGYPA
ncbi:uncharacterized protein LOC114828094 [Galendromus occidentalis]|uniref:Uncharacterized protein LOC114828094 n=1 Tax=Galendromus occidentalis TaxID=34638 RepID=A0AAJ7WGY1_9ACAR|nr:uncharacterized protein LOC114828094 [Galendromus occidentalis]